MEEKKEGKYSKNYNIFEAIGNNGLRRVKELIQSGVDIEQTYSKSVEFMDNSYYISTPLIFAVFYRDLGIDYSKNINSNRGIFCLI